MGQALRFGRAFRIESSLFVRYCIDKGVVQMDGKRLAQGLLNATGDDLRLVYALVMETKMLDLLVAKSKDLMNKELNHFELKLQEEIARLHAYSDEELQLKLFLYLLEQLDLHGSYFNLPKEIDYACAQIVAKTHALQMKQDKVYRAFAEEKQHDYDASSILVLYQMQKIFESFDEGRKELTEADTEQLVDQIDDYIQSLPLEKQQQIKEKLHIDELTNSTIKQLIASQGTAVIMAIIVEVAGFAAFTTLTSTIAATVGLFGITLPFGAYMFATSALSILTGPIGLALIAVGGGYLINVQNKKVRKTLLPIGVVQLLLPAMLEEQPVQYEGLITMWNRLYDRQRDYKADIEKAETSLAELLAQKQRLQSEYREVKAIITHLTSEHAMNMKKIEQQVESIVFAEMSEPFQQLSGQIAALRLQMLKLREEQDRNSTSIGFWNKVKGAVANTSLSSQLRKLEKERQALEAERTIEVVRMKPASMKGLCELIESNEAQLAKQQQDKEWLEARLEEKANDIQQQERALKYSRADLKDFQKVWYGFAHID